MQTQHLVRLARWVAVLSIPACVVLIVSAILGPDNLWWLVPFALVLTAFNFRRYWEIRQQAEDGNDEPK